MLKKLLYIIFLVVFIKAEDIVEYDYDIDIYYSSVSAFIDIDTDKNVTDATNFTEKQIYTKLIKNTFEPNVFLVEASFHPMSWGGVWYRRHYPSQYEKANINDFNLVKALTAGWEEPYSISFFIGRMMIFKRENSKHIGRNRAFIGYLITLGNKSIKDNMSYKDYWSNIEFKLKGTRELKDRNLDWSFRTGYRHHNNNDFVDTIYIGARRSGIDFKKSIWSIKYNSAFESMLEFNAKSFSVTKAKLILEKKWPLSFFKKVTFGLGVGYLYYGGNRYKGALKEEGIDKHQLILRPNLKW